MLENIENKEIKAGDTIIVKKLFRMRPVKVEIVKKGFLGKIYYCTWNETEIAFLSSMINKKTGLFRSWNVIGKSDA